MKNSFTVLIFLCTALTVYAKNNHGRSSEVKNITPDDPWIWGYSDEKFDANTNKDIKPTATPQKITEDPCISLPELTKPDFRAPGRRISQQKCQEYIWLRKFRDDKATRDKQCTNTGPSEMFFHIEVIGGHDALSGEFPHMAALGWKASEGTWVFKCGGTLISEKFVLTAAHCTQASPRDTTIAETLPKIVRMGDKNIIDNFANGLNPVDVNIARIIVHPQYRSPKKYFDIALLELEKVVEFTNNVQPACLWTSFDTTGLGTTAKVTGWGVIATGGRTTSPTLQTADVDLVDSKTCDRLLRPQCNRNWCGVQDTQICAGKLAGGVDSCQGDSGGPLQVKMELPKSSQGSMYNVVGVTSFGFSCALENTPGVYTRVSSFLDWIEGNVWPKG